MLCACGARALAGSIDCRVCWLAWWCRATGIVTKTSGIDWPDLELRTRRRMRSENPNGRHKVT